MSNQWRTITMNELYDYSYSNQNIFIKPSFHQEDGGIFTPKIRPQILKRLTILSTN
jgi:hypothetical protein